MSTQDYATRRGVAEKMSDEWEKLYNKAAAERDKLKAQRDALLAAAKWCVRLLDNLAKREQENSTAPHKDKFSMFEYTASKNAKAAIEEAEKP